MFIGSVARENNLIIAENKWKDNVDIQQSIPISLPSCSNSPPLNPRVSITIQLNIGYLRASVHTSINRSNRGAATVYYFCPLFPLALVMRIPTRSRSINGIGTAVSIFLKFRGRVRRKQKRERRIKTLAFPHFRPSSRTSVYGFHIFHRLRRSTKFLRGFFHFSRMARHDFEPRWLHWISERFFQRVKKRERREEREREREIAR